MPIARYATHSGLRGCYMPDSHGGPFVCSTRRDLADYIRNEIEMADFPKTAIRQVKLTRLWSHIKRHGSSVAHFQIHHADREITFVGLTEDECDAMERENA